MHRRGSVAGGSELTISGSGFGIEADSLSIEVAGVACAVTTLRAGTVSCRLAPIDASASVAVPFAGERGVRWRWARTNSSGGASSSGSDARGSLLLPSFALPSHTSALIAYSPAPPAPPPPDLPTGEDGMFATPDDHGGAAPGDDRATGAGRVITHVVYSSSTDAPAAGVPGRPSASGVATGLVPGTVYRVGIELLRNDLGSSNEKAKAMRAYPVVDGSRIGRYVPTELGGECWGSCGRCTGFTSVCGENGACCRRDSNTATFPECTGASSIRSYNGHGCLRADWEWLPSDSNVLELGECNPDGGDNDCTFFDCSTQFDTEQTFTAASSSLTLEIDLIGHSRDCDCNVSTWECAREDTVPGYAPMNAVARFTLTPLPAPTRAAGVAGWRELGATDAADDESRRTAHVLEGWFEPPLSASYVFQLRTDAVSSLRWSGNESALPTALLARVDPADLSPAVIAPQNPWSSLSPQPVTVELWTRASQLLTPGGPAWTCATPPCRADFGASARTPVLGAADATMNKRRVDMVFATGAPIASRFTGRFRAPITGDCALTLSAVTSLGAARLFVDGALAVAHDGGAAATSRTISVIAGQWHGFEVVHYDPGAPSSRPGVSAQMRCDGVDGDAFPINLADPSPSRRARAHQPWPPRWADEDEGIAVSAPLALERGRRYWLQLECGSADAPCAVGTRILTPSTPHAADLGAPSRRWRARVHRGTASSVVPVTCAAITDKAECCTAIDGTNSDVFGTRLEPDRQHPSP